MTEDDSNPPKPADAPQNPPQSSEVAAPAPSETQRISEPETQGSAPAPEPRAMNLPLYATAASLIAGGALLVSLLRPAPTGVTHDEEAPQAQASANPLPEPPLTFASLSDNLRSSMAATQGSKVVYEDILGEGEGHW